MKTENFHTTNTLPLMEAFYTLQGEGYHSGKAAYFIRLAGCDVGCFWCDVKESWEAEKHPQVTVNEIVEMACQHPSRLAVITGGEPLMHNLETLTTNLKTIGFQTHIETSGAYPLSGHFDWICLSPKRFKPALDEFFLIANELKVVIFKEKDLIWAEGFASRVSKDCQLFLQPEWDKAPTVLPLIMNYIKDNPKWRISLQTHKYMDIP
jgi:organic radical activating enzyme